MKLCSTIIFLLLSAKTFACDQVVAGYEKSIDMFVICDDLSTLSTDEAIDLIIKLFNQYKGPPDEVGIYFIRKPEFIGNPNVADDDLVGFYYTHDNNLIIWPNSKVKKRTIQIVWK